MCELWLKLRWNQNSPESAAVLSVRVERTDVSDVDARRPRWRIRGATHARTHIFTPTVIQTPVVHQDLTSTHTRSWFNLPWTHSYFISAGSCCSASPSPPAAFSSAPLGSAPSLLGHLKGVQMCSSGRRVPQRWCVRMCCLKTTFSEAKRSGSQIHPDDLQTRWFYVRFLELIKWSINVPASVMIHLLFNSVFIIKPSEKIPQLKWGELGLAAVPTFDLWPFKVTAILGLIDWHLNYVNEKKIGWVLDELRLVYVSINVSKWEYSQLWQFVQALTFDL